ncbi:MAG TPA: FGGY-family carbohydrate kinase [Polyangiaceae bacterium]|nr:FGGY-family carbohydrate kinase [Polyangiaceae bacterium]
MPYYLGLDSSTQSLSAMAIDPEQGRVVLDESVNFGRDLPQYASPHGFLENANPNIKHSNPLMWVDALDLLLSRVRASGFDLSKVAAVSGAGQQHGSVYLATPLSEAGNFPADRPLVDSVGPLLSRASSPIWMDSSTSAACGEIASAVGGDSVVTRVTGSRTIERFTGPQIRKFYRDEPASYAKTREIHLVSSFMASLLVGTTAPIDLGDGAGMNLLDLATGSFSRDLLEATAPGLGAKLPGPVPSTQQVGEVAGYFIEKYGFSPGTRVYAFTGDNPSSLIGMGASAPGTAVVSMGTSDTVFAAMREPRTDPQGFGHVFGNPAGGFMSLICFANGSLARERVAKDLGYDWNAFTRAILEETQPGNAGNLVLPYFAPEMTPKILAPAAKRFGSQAFVAGEQPAALVRGIVEAQALSMQHHSRWIGETPNLLLVTGGASRNRGILQVLADVFQAEIRTLRTGNSSALGAALRAAQAGGGHDWADLYARFAAPDPDLQVAPSPGTARAYDDLRARFVAELDSLT